MLKITTLLFSLLLSECSFSFVVLIDPGHGGTEHGATTKVTRKNSKGKYYTRTVYEKDLALILAKKVKKHLQAKHSTYLTRSFDRTVTLEKRAEMADTVKADIFISIHFNSSTEKKSHGFETYYLDNHDDVAIKKVEMIENENLKGKDRVVNQILIDLVIDKTVVSSKKLANMVHKNISKKISKKFQMTDRGVKPGLFYVLALSKRPGILIEAGFISNPNEMKKLSTPNYLDNYAKGIAMGISKFIESRPKRGLPLF